MIETVTHTTVSHLKPSSKLLYAPTKVLQGKILSLLFPYVTTDIFFFYKKRQLN